MGFTYVLKPERLREIERVARLILNPSSGYKITGGTLLCSKSGLNLCVNYDKQEEVIPRQVSVSIDAFECVQRTYRAGYELADPSCTDMSKTSIPLRDAAEFVSAIGQYASTSTLASIEITHDTVYLLCTDGVIRDFVSVKSTTSPNNTNRMLQFLYALRALVKYIVSAWYLPFRSTPLSSNSMFSPSTLQESDESEDGVFETGVLALSLSQAAMEDLREKLQLVEVQKFDAYYLARSVYFKYLDESKRLIFGIHMTPETYSHQDITDIGEHITVAWYPLTSGHHYLNPLLARRLFTKQLVRMADRYKLSFGERKLYHLEFTTNEDSKIIYDIW
jgi:hypothetical protein